MTSIAMCLKYFETPARTNIEQFEDELYRYALDRGYSRHSPYDLADIVRDYGCKDYFTENALIEDVQDWVASGKPAVIHGYFAILRVSINFSKMRKNRKFNKIDN